MQQHFRESENQSTAPITTSGTRTLALGKLAGQDRNTRQLSISGSVSARRVSVFTIKDLLTCGISGAIYGGVSLILFTLDQISGRTAGSEIWFWTVLFSFGFAIIGAGVLPFNHGWRRKDWRQGLLMATVIMPLGITGMQEE